jgi:NAD(P)-dependent dehydrogenase (short-subunit alcohol dehydrogenase family)
MGETLRGETAVVTGAASGNGRAIAREFAREGADIVVADKRERPREGGKPTDEVIEESTDSGAVHVECDVTDLAELRKAIGTAEQFGGISVLVNNAGVINPGSFLEVTPEEYSHAMNVNTRSTFFASQFAAKRMIEDDIDGNIINISSVAGLRGQAGGVTYCTAKGAVTIMTYALADELGPHGIRVNAIHPGYIETAMFEEDVPGPENRAEILAEEIPLRRIGEPRDIARAAVYLASGDSGYVTGTSLAVDGGMSNTE